ncbi:hypothetical protein EDC01DRAFT_629909 [Geopyxis carbonaria]|nr:hypothetical protein EDC01DRAFT_629909 [Geopyxis carbonaria]
MSDHVQLNNSLAAPQSPLESFSPDLTTSNYGSISSSFDDTLPPLKSCLKGNNNNNHDSIQKKVRFNNKNYIRIIPPRPREPFSTGLKIYLSFVAALFAALVVVLVLLCYQ